MLDYLIFSDYFQTVIGIAALIAYVIAVSKFFKRISERRVKERSRFFNSLTVGLKHGAIASLSDVENLYKGVCRIYTEDSTKPARLSKWLREYLVELLEARVKEQADERIKWKETITEFINQIDQQSPYANLPDLEGNILTDIEVFLKTDDKKAIERKLGELTAALQVREESFSKLRSTNRWAVPLAMIGLVLTITFGLISILK